MRSRGKRLHDFIRHIPFLPCSYGTARHSGHGKLNSPLVFLPEKS